MNKRIKKEKLKDILAKYPSNKFDSLDDIHPADIVDLLEENEENIKLIKKLPENMSRYYRFCEGWWQGKYIKKFTWRKEEEGFKFNSFRWTYRPYGKLRSWRN